MDMVVCLTVSKFDISDFAEICRSVKESGTFALLYVQARPMSLNRAERYTDRLSRRGLSLPEKMFVCFVGHFISNCIFDIIYLVQTHRGCQSALKGHIYHLCRLISILLFLSNAQ